MDVFSTRKKEVRVPATLAVLEGISSDGGLFVPDYFPRLNADMMLPLVREGYQATAAEILSLFFDIGTETLRTLTKEAYASFDTDEVVPLKQLGEREYVMELFHGPTLAFKDLALQVLPRLLKLALVEQGQKEDVLVLAATSGDTGKAAMEGFRDVDRTFIYVFYPQDGVADLQKLQMVTQQGKNVGVCAVQGNFDDAQTGVKELFGDPEFNKWAKKHNFTLSSANSINIGRLIPQIAYYAYTYGKLVMDGKVKSGVPVNFVVPTGNFGNILAAYYAKKMGTPIKKLICASNRNNVLTDFFQHGVYDSHREFFKTMSPSMDILISSNLERLLFEIASRDSQIVCGWMDALRIRGSYEVPARFRKILTEDFYADYCTEEETADAIKRTFEKHGYLMDPHTAVAQAVYEKYVQSTDDETLSVVVSTAHPFKFTQDVLAAVTGERVENPFEAADKLSGVTGVPVPPQIGELMELPVLHRGGVAKHQLKNAVENFVRGE